MAEDNRYKTLYYFTESYPYGISEQWKRDELEVFREYFDRIVVIPRSHGGNPVARNIVEGVEYREPLINATEARGVAQKLRVQLSGVLNGRFLKELTRAASDKAATVRLLKHAYQIELIKASPSMRDVLDHANRDPAILYFFWAIGTADIIPFLPDNRDVKVCRFHGWDLYEERHARGIPFRRELLDALDLGLPCSDYGAEYLRKRYPRSRAQVYTARLSTRSHGRSPLVDDGVLKLLTCSSVTQVKRLDRLCAALAHIDVPTRWTHIGDGNLMDEIKKLAEGTGPNVSVDFVGNLPSEEVLDFMTKHPFDLFVNVSESEGVPVSVMEAFSAAIPVYATNVGGTFEIVDETVGKLLPGDADSHEIASELAAFHRIQHETKARMRDAAFERYEERSNASTNARRLAEVIIESAKAKRV